MKIASIIAGVLVLAIVGFAVVEKVSPVGWGLWGETNTSDGVALEGYDPVAYFEDETAVPGLPEFTHEWRSATWQFASAEHRAMFAADPERFAPQFGNFCAFAVSKGFTANASPTAWHIADGKLYVFADENVRDDWVESIAEGSRDASETNWSKRQ